MSEVLVRFDEPIAGPDGRKYFALAVGKETPGGRWEGWLEFLLVDDSSEPLCSERETTQPNRRSLDYWAQGLTRVYLQGALGRAATPPTTPARRVQTGAPRRSAAPPRKPRIAGDSKNARPILDPYAVYAQGEHILRSELSALSRDQVETIVAAYGFSARRSPASSATPTGSDLVDTVVNGVRSAESR